MLNVLKWIGTGCVIAAAGCRSLEYHTADLILSIIGAGVWTYAAIAMKDKALLVVNAFIVAILMYGVIS